MIEPGDGTKLVVRPVQMGDAGELAPLIVQLGYVRPAVEVARWIAELGPGQAAFVACLGAEVVGWIEVSIQHHLQYEPYALIGGLVVKEGVRGQRIGQRLCRQAEDWAAGQGLKEMRVTSRSTREDAHRFYLRDGYRQVKTSVVFEKKLGECAPSDEVSS